MNLATLKPTPCEDCEHVHPSTLSKPSYQWMCMKFPRLDGLDPVAPKTRAVKEPYNRCQSVNAGFCPMFERRRDGQKELV